MQGTASESQLDGRERKAAGACTVCSPGFRGNGQGLVSDAVMGSPGDSTCCFLMWENQASPICFLSADEGLMKFNKIMSVGQLCRTDFNLIWTFFQNGINIS